MSRSVITVGVLVGFVLVYVAVGLYEESKRPWESLRGGMSEDRVAAIMGKPDVVLPTESGEEWRYPNGIAVRFAHGSLYEIKGGKRISHRW